MNSMKRKLNNHEFELQEIANGMKKKDDIELKWNVKKESCVSYCELELELERSVTELRARTGFCELHVTLGFGASLSHAITFSFFFFFSFSSYCFSVQCLLLS